MRIPTIEHARLPPLDVMARAAPALPKSSTTTLNGADAVAALGTCHQIPINADHAPRHSALPVSWAIAGRRSTPACRRGGPPASGFSWRHIIQLLTTHYDDHMTGTMSKPRHRRSAGRTGSVGVMAGMGGQSGSAGRLPAVAVVLAVVLFCYANWYLGALILSDVEPGGPVGGRVADLFPPTTLSRRLAPCCELTMALTMVMC